MNEIQQNAQNQFKSQEEAKEFAKQNEGKVKIKNPKKSNKPESDGWAIM